MDDYDYSGEYDNFDTQDFGTLGDTTGWNGEGGDGYSGYQTPQSNNNGGYDFQSEYNNFGQQPQYSDMFGGMNNFGQGLQPTQDLNNLGDYSNMGNLSNPLPQTAQQGWGGDVQNVLSQLFGSGGALGGKGGQGLVAGLGALMEGRQNKKQAQNMQQVVQQQQQRLSPYDSASAGASAMGASSMRDAMQQKLAAAMQDPYGQPMVKAQVDQIQRMQAIKDAAAGRRSNSATSDPAMLAAQAQIAQQYMNSLQNPAGANISPNQQGLEALLGAQKYDTNGYVSPIMSALGYNSGMNTAQNNQAQNIPPELLAKVQEWYKGQQ